MLSRSSVRATLLVCYGFSMLFLGYSSLMLIRGNFALYRKSYMDVVYILSMCRKLESLYVQNLFVVPVSSWTPSRVTNIKLFVLSLINVCPMTWSSFVMIASRYMVSNWRALYLELPCLTYRCVVLGIFNYYIDVYVIGDFIV